MTPNGAMTIDHSAVAVVHAEPPTRSPAQDFKRRLSIMAALAALCLLWSWRAARQAHSSRDSFQTLLVQTEQMSRDVNLLESLRSAPRLAADRARPNSELLEQVRRSLEHAGIVADRWLANDPSPPKRSPDSPYKQYETRLTFQDVGLQRVVAMLHFLVDEDPTLTVSRLRLSAPATDRQSGWNVDLTLSYLVYAPHNPSSQVSDGRIKP